MDPGTLVCNRIFTVTKGDIGGMLDLLARVSSILIEALNCCNIFSPVTASSYMSSRTQQVAFYPFWQAHRAFQHSALEIRLPASQNAEPGKHQNGQPRWDGWEALPKSSRKNQPPREWERRVPSQTLWPSHAPSSSPSSIPSESSSGSSGLPRPLLWHPSSSVLKQLVLDGGVF